MLNKNLAMAIGVTFFLAFIGMLIAVNFTISEADVSHEIPRLYSTRDPQFRRAIGSLLGPPLVGGNRVQELLNGDQIFPVILTAIKGAQQTITFKTYIYWSGDIGNQFAAAISERANAGVKVHVLLDWLGSTKIDESILDEMRAAGVEIRKFRKPNWYNLTRLNNRTHRKLLVVDGKTKFTGGVGIAPKWTGNCQDANHWRDSHFRIERPVVAQMQAVFMENWLKVTGQVMYGKKLFSSGPDGGHQRRPGFFKFSLRRQ